MSDAEMERGKSMATEIVSVERTDDEAMEETSEPDTRLAPMSLRRYDERSPRW
jgi:hypothetical protein